MDLKNNKITVGELLDSPAARAVFQRRFPMVMKHPLLGAARTVTLEQVISFAQDVYKRQSLHQPLPLCACAPPVLTRSWLFAKYYLL